MLKHSMLLIVRDKQLDTESSFGAIVIAVRVICLTLIA